MQRLNSLSMVSHTLLSLCLKAFKTLDGAAPWLALVFLRVLIGWEFLEAGLEKYNGENWFTDIQHRFPFPFNVIPPSISWEMATWFELIGGAALIIGVGTRFFAISLMILTIVATAAVHWPAEWMNFSDLAKGYAVSDKGYGNFKLPVIFLAMLIPLLFSGPGKLSIDALFHRFSRRLA